MMTKGLISHDHTSNQAKKLANNQILGSFAKFFKFKIKAIKTCLMPIQWDLLNMIHKNMIIDDMITRNYGQASQ